MAQASKAIQQYFDRIKKEVNTCYEVAGKARKKGLDPEDHVEIPAVEDMAGRVEGLLSVLVPQIVGSGVRERIKELEEVYGSLDWRISLIISVEIAKEQYCKFKDKKEALEIGIRAGLAYHTMGVVASPLEGFVELLFRKRKDNGQEYFALRFSGPIRSAGGTGASVCVLIADYVRKQMGYAEYDPTEVEISRTITELYDYHDRITNLQYLPSEDEIKFLYSHIPCQIDGDPSEKIEVSNYKDLERVDTNNIRNGVCLVLGEALAQKAPKLWKQLSKWGHEFEMEQWDFLGDFVDLQKKIKAKGSSSKNSGDKPKIMPDYTFIKDIVAGRPVLTHPMRNGGFRLRYGRSRVSGFSSNSVHPATMHVVNEYAATGTQLKMERPGKACSLTVCDHLEGPIVKLKDGSVLQLHTYNDSKALSKKVSEILYLGDMLVNYGDFFNRAHKLVPPGYCGEWWTLELNKICEGLFGFCDYEKLKAHCSIDSDILLQLISNPFTTRPTFEEALALSLKARAPLHPCYTYFWRSISSSQFIDFLHWLDTGNFQEDNKGIKLVLPSKHPGKRALELLGIPHIVIHNEFVQLGRDDSSILHKFFFELNSINDLLNQFIPESDVLSFLNSHLPFLVRDKAGLFLGARMGRPEKSKMRRLTGSPQVLFPVGDEGGRLRSFNSALDEKKITGDFPLMYCKTCDKESIYRRCAECGSSTKQQYWCRSCEKRYDEDTCPQHGPCRPHQRQEIDSIFYVKKAVKMAGMRQIPNLVKGVRGVSNKTKIPEHLSKGMLRAKHGIYVNKDGTTRYDMSELGITHFKPFEIGTSVKKLQELGYTQDIEGNRFERDDQVLEIKPQDIILPSLDKPLEGADTVLRNVANFIDELLVTIYGQQSYYNIKSNEDLAGQLVVCLAPHTSAAIVARVIGFSKLQGFFAHPMIHAAQRRDLDGDESCVALLLDALLNFSRHYLPAHRGSTQDAPLVLTSTLTPAEVDDMVFDMDVCSSYPLEFYEACLAYKDPWDVTLDQIKERLGKDSQYEGMSYTHPTTDINDGVHCSAYKTLASMNEKLEGQMDLAARLRAVDKADVARLVVERHFIRDTKGNLRKFSMQKFRCVSCNEKFRRPPLIGKCTNCQGKILFTISEGSVVKYLQKTVELVENYDVSPYLKKSISLLQRRIEYVFGKEKEKQETMSKWF